MVFHYENLPFHRRSLRGHYRVVAILILCPLKDIEVRDLGFRWGSCGQAGGVNFHWATILLPVSVVDYVIVHELAHLVEPNHTPEFWRHVGRALPEYEQRKGWLAEHGGQHLVL